MTLNPLLLIETLLKATILIGVAGLLASIFWKASAALRHLFWLCALAGLLVLPAAVLWTPDWRPDLPTTFATTIENSRQAITVTATRETAGIPWWSMLLTAWIAGTILLLARIGLDARAAARVARRSSPFPAIDSADLLSSPEIDVPLVCGLRKPLVVMPAESVEWPVERFRLAAEHERMHVKRRDTFWHLLARTVCALYWPHPLVWWAAAQLRTEAERACDDGVVTSGERPSEYAGHLMEIAGGLAPRERVPQGGIPMARRSNIGQRLRALLDPRLNRRPASTRLAATVMLSAAALLVSLAAFRAPALALQNEGLAGRVKDMQEQPVAKARVSATRTDAGGRPMREFTLTNDRGEYRLAPLPAGVYRLNVEKTGFTRVEINSLAVRNGQETQASVTLMASGEDAAPPPVRLKSPAPAPAGTKRIEVGGNVQQMKLEHKVMPSYPADCKQQGIEGTVLLLALIDKAGLIANLEGMNKLVDPRLVVAATEAVKQWRYQPTLLNGEAVEVITEIEVNFRLQ